jgi:Nif-specific regulatory protein
MLDVDTNGALLEASRAINSSLDLHSTLQSVAREAAQVMGAEAASVLVLDPRRNKLVFKAVFGQKEDQLIDQEFDSNLGVAGKVAGTKKPMLIGDVAAERNFFGGFDHKLEFKTRNMVCAPIIHQNKVIGVVEVLNCRNKPGFCEGDLDLLQIFANLAALGMVNAERYEGLKRQNEGLRMTGKATSHIIGSEGSLKNVMGLVGKVAHTTASVLLLGETGTGKELIARTIHQQSPRTDFPFIGINCAAIPEGLLESELFGHEKGAFTGAIGQKPGRFELADGGTLFLDEVGELTPTIQVKLLRVLQEKEFVRVGGTKTLTTDVRIIAATNRDLKIMMQNGGFREDLFYRLNVFPIHLPPLRERRADIPDLIDYYLAKIAADLKVPAPALNLPAMELLTTYAWPGNIRELQNVIERAVLLCAGKEITIDDLPREITGQSESPGQPSPPPSGLSLPEHEKLLCLQALEKTQWNQSKAARDLGISRDHLRYRIKKFGLEKNK